MIISLTFSLSLCLSISLPFYFTQSHISLFSHIKGEDYTIRDVITVNLSTSEICWTISIMDNFEYEEEEFLYLTWNNISSARLEPAEFVLMFKDNDVGKNYNTVIVKYLMRT